MNKKLPYLSITILAIITGGCLLAGVLSGQDPYYMNTDAVSQAPSAVHLFGTDTLGRDIFAIIWHGGRLSLMIGLTATLISTAIAIVYGCLSGLAGPRIDDLMMRFTEILMSIPQILLVIFLQAIWGEPTVFSIGIVLGITSWMAVAKMVRSEVRQMREAEYVLAARSMGAGFFYILWNHLMPNFMSAIMFMIVTNLGSAIATEATLSFLGLGLPTGVVSWGSLMSLSQKAMLTGAWWLLIIPGAFLVITLICITEIGEYLRTTGRRDRLI
ncbi:ABC transporter permease [Anaerovorax odorimutans]|uniref:ABC transporter permease n=1 Tax=Anaerovorax odorimutans TaxID=109327 RepID=A0ABT1RPD5_9FIRM|nr:ABC transporter permease [Anaerovorax odorimutans]MCQ4636746.1 ABC transporter permease [Anaerovorax odorimutans]